MLQSTSNESCGAQFHPLPIFLISGLHASYVRQIGFQQMRTQLHGYCSITYSDLNEQIDSFYNCMVNLTGTIVK